MLAYSVIQLMMFGPLTLLVMAMLLVGYMLHCVLDHVWSQLGVAYDSHRNIFYWAIDGGATALRQLTGGSTTSSELPLVANPTSVALDYIGQRTVTQ